MKNLLLFMFVFILSLPNIAAKGKEVSIENGEISLNGTIVFPKVKEGKLPAVILISGSGQVSRESEREPYKKLSKEFVKKGFVVLYFDKRGTGMSSGVYSTATTWDFASDVHAWVEYLQGLEEIDETKIGLFGHSEGGLIAPMVAEQSNDIAFLVLYAPPAIKMGELIRMRTEKGLNILMEQNPELSEKIEMLKLYSEFLFDNVIPSKMGCDESVEALESFLQEKNAPDEDIEEAKITMQFELEDQPLNWYRSIIDTSASDFLENLSTTHIHAVFGTNDMLVPSDLNAQALSNSLERAGNENLTLEIIEGLNHDYRIDGNGGISRDLLKNFAAWAQSIQ